MSFAMRGRSANVDILLERRGRAYMLTAATDSMAPDPT